MPYDVADLRRTEFPITERYAYFNNCGIAPLPVRGARAVQEFIQSATLEGTEGFLAWMPTIERTRSKLARLLNTSSDDIALIKNTAEGFTIVAQAIPWQRGDVILVAQDEFPATIYPWQMLQRDGVEVCIVPHQNERITADTFAPFLAGGKVRLVVVSWVQFHTGWRADLAEIGALCRDAGAMLCVDAIQGVGALPLDLTATRVDFCMFGGNKWMMSLQGTGALYVNGQIRDQLHSANVGWLSVPWTGIEVLDPTTPLDNRAAQYEEGTRVSVCITALEQSLDLMQELGIHNIAAQIKHTTDLLVAGLIERGATIRSQRDGEHWSGIVAWTHPDRELHEVAAALQAADVLVTIREGSLRAAPHCFNDASDVARLLAALDGDR